MVFDCQFIIEIRYVLRLTNLCQIEFVDFFQIKMKVSRLQKKIEKIIIF